jgi:hypothetical protein
MNNAVRAWVLLVVTLCLGIAIGLLGGGALQDRRMARVNSMRGPSGFVEHVREVIQPTSDSQWTAIRPLVEATAEQSASLRRAHDIEMRANIDSLKARLEPMLDAAQRERFSRFVLRPPRPPGPFGPPQAGPGGRGPNNRGGPDDRRGPPPDGPPPPSMDEGRSQPPKP